MIEAFTIKQWTAIYFLIGCGGWIIVAMQLFSIKTILRKLLNESELVKYLRSMAQDNAGSKNNER